MDVGYTRRGISGNISMPFYRTPNPTPPFGAPPVQTVAKAFKPSPPELKPKWEIVGVDVHVEKSNGGELMSSEVDRRAATYILSVRERLRREI
ncbi:hypothetical protein FCM35_KLT12374 [Carex littledalei]|uniref:Uncharacterized protein n=1 Tax=Carex littledalei TaxID=544730 RepID=A0A833QH78_9POAL|nr:hypothetical protein FCM35_KLT12374 [Carex littledalei]